MSRSSASERCAPTGTCGVNPGLQRLEPIFDAVRGVDRVRALRARRRTPAGSPSRTRCSSAERRSASRPRACWRSGGLRWSAYWSSRSPLSTWWMITRRSRSRCSAAEKNAGIQQTVSCRAVVVAPALEPVEILERRVSADRTGSRRRPSSGRSTARSASSGRSLRVADVAEDDVDHAPRAAPQHADARLNSRVLGVDAELARARALASTGGADAGVVDAARPRSMIESTSTPVSRSATRRVLRVVADLQRPDLR